jgi:hypothetical protein
MRNMWDGYKTVKELSEDELDELRDKVYWIMLEAGEVSVDDFDSVTNEMLYEQYEGINFVYDDFFCNS